MKFCEKLKILCNILNCNNNTLADASMLDASLISRLKSGKRIPAKNTIQFNKLISGISKIIKEYNKENEIREFIKATPNISIEKEVSDWLCQPTGDGSFWARKKSAVFHFFSELHPLLFSDLSLLGIKIISYSLSFYQ